jgi:hypothetical protein
MIRLWSFETCACGAAHDHEPITAKRIPKTIKCACGKRVGWATMKANGISDTPYGRFDPQFGCVVESYAHKQRLLKQTGMIEVSGPEKMDDILADGDKLRPASEPDPSVIRADSIEEITGNIPRDRIDWKHTGNPDRPMLDCWTEL